MCGGVAGDGDIVVEGSSGGSGCVCVMRGGGEGHRFMALAAECWHTASYAGRSRGWTSLNSRHTNRPPGLSTLNAS